MRQKIIEYIRQYNMIKNGDRVLVALSGGPDSICLLHILNSLKDILNIEIFVAHVNHCLRGDDADEDERYVKEFCEKLQIPCYIKKANINKIAEERKISSEMAGREIRYEFFDEIFKNENLNKIAIAHNANDQAETILMRIMRGTGLEGLIGIKPIRDYKYIRPILCLTRDEIEKYCESNNLNPRIDKTNLENIYSRNKIRLDMIPYIKENFNSDIVSTLNRLASLSAIDQEYIEGVCDEKYERFCKEYRESITIDKGAFKENRAILSRIIRKVYIKLNGNGYNFEMKHIDDIVSLQKGETGKEIHLPNDIICKNIYGEISIYLNNKKNDFKLDEIFISKNQLKTLKNINLLEKIGYDICIDIFPNKSIQFDNNSLIKYFDYDKIKEGITIRAKKDGDKIIPLGMNGSKKIKSIFIDAKIPKEERNKIPLVCFDQEIAWIVGLKVSNLFKVSKKTQDIIKIKFIERKR
ncbi:tRNA lysidine(34) synthetase TilS [Clostridium fallax]|uniref:tRNA(Ile)-lysidine synthase n=1 Tax=Clostridium fallax TaxID=1533 RepID=A0A1M4TFK6_9CLOT|nr:tRNA lysidine(34) synthetase TilS [Clostridium fallax]SHE43077.1 tRNA(Ile)-lysidine synthase [Clostridium fallax]SQB22731.1 cell cycle protein MesJ [Clostridium fallax]